MLKNKMINFVKSTYPDLIINEIKINNKGWDNDILIVNNEIVFRFPKTEQVYSKILDELILLESLAKKKPILQLPNYELMDSKSSIKGVKYPFLQGRSLSEYTFKDISKDPDNAKRIGDFLTKIHSIVPSELQNTNLKTIHTQSYWKKVHLSVKSEVFPYFDKQQQDEFNEVLINFINIFPSLTYKKCVIHGDLTTSNIIYNKNKECVVGIIDFTDSQIADPAFDFAGLYWTLGPEFTKEVLSWYTTSESLDAMFNRVKTFYGLQPVFHEMLYSVRNKRVINQESIKRFSELKNMAR